MSCRHTAFDVDATVAQLVVAEGEVLPVRLVSVRARCSDCGEPFVFAGLPESTEQGRPGVERSGLTAVLPILPFTTAYPTEASEPVRKGRS